MAKKFGKFLLFTAAVGTVAAAAYYYFRKKDAAAEQDGEDEDYDDFSEDLEDDMDAASRTYVPLNGALSAEKEAAADAGADNPEKEAEAADGQEAFTPLTEQVAERAVEKAAEATEEFFDEDDPQE